jgi:hypothetical protein
MEQTASSFANFPSAKEYCEGGDGAEFCRPSIPMGKNMNAAVADAGKGVGEAQIFTEVTHQVILGGAVTKSLSFTLKPRASGAHIFALSNCNFLKPSDNDLEALTINIQSGSIAWSTQYGTLPIHLIGLLPFYAVLGGFYFLLSLLWLKRTSSFHESELLGLQKAVARLCYAEFFFSMVALAYYVHLNTTHVDIEILYSGSAAALVSWDFWSILMGLSHFSTILFCQIVVSLAADGKWITSHQTRPETKGSIVALIAGWAVYIVFYSTMGPSIRRAWFVLCAVLWLSSVIFSVSRSLRHIKALIVGSSSDPIMVAHPGSKRGEMLTAKRSLFRKMCFSVALYPMIFILSLALNLRSDKANAGWAWAGYVLGDLYIFIMLCHTSYLWMPREKEEYAKYAPLESLNGVDDPQDWLDYDDEDDDDDDEGGDDGIISELELQER